METITTNSSFQFGKNPTCLIQIYQHLFTSGRLECDNFSYVSIYYPICATRFTHIESSGNLEFLLSKTNVSAKIQELKSFIKKNNLSLTVHAPTWAVELASPNESIRKASVEAIINIFDLIKSLNSEALVLHLAGDFGSSVKKSEIFMRGYTRCL